MAFLGPSTHHHPDDGQAKFDLLLDWAYKDMKTCKFETMEFGDK